MRKVNNSKSSIQWKKKQVTWLKINDAKIQLRSYIERNRNLKSCEELTDEMHIIKIYNENITGKEETVTVC